METGTLPQIVLEIGKQHTAGNATEAARLFQLVYARVRERAYKVYVGILYAAFKTNKESSRADEVFIGIIEELERYIQKGKFAEKETDKEVIDEFVRLVRQRVYHRTVNRMKKWNRTPLLHSADLPEGWLDRVADQVSTDTEDDELAKRRIAYVFGKLSEKDADLLRTRFYSQHSREKANAILMKRYEYDEPGSLDKAIWWAKKRFKALWKQSLQKEESQTTNTNLKPSRHEVPT